MQKYYFYFILSNIFMNSINKRPYLLGRGALHVRPPPQRVLLRGSRKEESIPEGWRLAGRGWEKLSAAVVGVVGGDGVAEGLARDVGVDFGGGDGGVAEHLLHGAQVGAVVDQLGGEAVA